MHTNKDRLRKEAQARQAAYNALSLQQRLDRATGRRGHSTKETSLLRHRIQQHEERAARRAHLAQQVERRRARRNKHRPYGGPPPVAA